MTGVQTCALPISRQETILRAVEGFRDLGADEDRIKEILKKKYGFSDEEAEAYL